MHSNTTASASIRAAVWIARISSRMFGGPSRWTGSSDPSGRISLADVPVVFATVRIPAPRKVAATSLVTLDFPRVPFTCTRMGIRRSAPR